MEPIWRPDHGNSAAQDIDLQSSVTRQPFAALYHGFGRWTKQTERYPFRISIKASDGATERQSLIATKTQPLRDYGSPQGQDRCTVDKDGSTSVHWFQTDFTTSRLAHHRWHGLLGPEQFQRAKIRLAVTQGRKLVVLIGQKKAVAIAVRSISGRRRWSKLQKWLRPGRPLSRQIGMAG
jgi:hypothetical protein